jgi:cytochrome P450
MLDVYSKEYQQNPYLILTALQDKTRFYYRKVEGDWLVLRHHDVKQLLHDHSRLKSSHPLTNINIYQEDSKLSGIESILQETQLFWKLSLPNIDQPEHTRVRRTLQPAFDEHFLSNVVDFVSENACKHLEQIKAKQDTQVDLIQTYTQPVLNQMVAHLFGFPLSLAQKFGAGALSLALIHDITNTREESEQAEEALLRFYTYIKSVLPKLSQSANSFMRVFIEQYENQKLSYDELIAQLVMFYMVSQVTPQDLINSAIYHLLQNLDLRDEVTANPVLIPQLITETLRYESPVQYIARRPHEDIELFGEKITRGQRIVLMVAAAHHDPQVFEKPHQFDIHRDTLNHLILSFGSGIHHCMGAYVAPIVARIVIEKLLIYLPNIRLDTERESHWQKQFLLRGLETLPVLI